MVKLVGFGTLIAGATAVAVAGVGSAEAPSKFDSVTELATVIERVRPNTIVVGPAEAARPTMLEVGALPPYEPATAAVYAAWSQARGAMSRWTRMLHNFSVDPLPAVAVVPCDSWHVFGSAEDTEPSNVRVGCER
jgi:hypothetical protein